MMKEGPELTGEDMDILKYYAECCGTLVELGTFYGEGSIFFSKLVEKVVTIDVFEWLDLIKSEKNRKHYTENFKEKFRYYKDIKKKLSKYPNIQVIHGVTHLEAKKFDDHSIDFLFVDADHSYEGVKRDFEAWYSKVKPSSIIAFHDSNPENGWEGIPFFMKQLNNDPRVDFIELKGSVSIFRSRGI